MLSERTRDADDIDRSGPATVSLGTYGSGTHVWRKQAFMPAKTVKMLVTTLVLTAALGGLLWGTLAEGTDVLGTRRKKLRSKQ